MSTTEREMHERNVLYTVHRWRNRRYGELLLQVHAAVLAVCQQDMPREVRGRDGGEPGELHVRAPLQRHVPER